VDALAESDFAALPLTNEWLFSMGFLTDAAAILGETKHAARMYELLLPYASHTGATADYICTGSMARSLGILATAMSEWEKAEQHFDEALAMNESVGGRPWAARTRHDLARMLLARDEPGDRERASDLLTEVIATYGKFGMAQMQERAQSLLEGSETPAPVGSPRPSVFRREGDYWSIAFGGRAFRLKDLKGLRYLARMLAEPGREFHVLDLAGGQLDRGKGEPGSNWSELGDAGEILDPQAKEAYRRRLADLDEEAENARTMGDPERAARADEEREAIIGQLAGAIGLGGRDRRAGSASERARAAVTRAIRAALARIAQHDSELGHHLASTIRTGTFCSYVPDPRAPADWQL
jgi:tetratricopeptide (TPR) repeat protein